MDKILTQIVLSAKFPASARYGGTVLLILVVEIFRQALGDPLSGFPFLLFFPAIFSASLVFDHRSGLLASLLSAGLVAWFWAAPRGGLWFQDSDHALGVGLFLLIGIGIAEVTEALRDALLRNARASREKDVFLDELHHRVRNDFQTVQAILSLSKADRHDPAEALSKAIDRVGIMSRVYTRMKPQAGTSIVNMQEFVVGLAEDLQLSRVGLRPIAIRARAEKVDFNAQCAMAVGVAINEAVTNALKYAFPNDRLGVVEITFGREKDNFILMVADDGVGMTAAAPQGTGIGSKLVKQVAHQLGGNFDLQQTDEGTKAIMWFPARACHG